MSVLLNQVKVELSLTDILEDVIETIPNDIKFLDEPRLPKKVDVLVMINSQVFISILSNFFLQVDETNLRRDIRRSWGNSTNFDSEMTTVVFVLGKPVRSNCFVL